MSTLRTALPSGSWWQTGAAGTMLQASGAIIEGKHFRI
jgi:hypothetical protein